jgi:flavodoxin I
MALLGWRGCDHRQGSLKKLWRKIMGKKLVVYDSFFGNTEQVAQVIAKALGDPASVGILKVQDVLPEHLVGLEVLLVGSPTRAFRPTKPVVRLIKGFHRNSLKGVKVAAFDTRVSVSDAGSRVFGFLVNAFGYAADTIALWFERKAGELVLPPEGFLVKGSEGPLKEGELERAAAWAAKIK